MKNGKQQFIVSREASATSSLSYLLSTYRNRLIKELVHISHWKMHFIVLFIAGISLFFSFPSYEALADPEIQKEWMPVLEKFEDPLKDMSEYTPRSHAYNLTFRLTVPIIAKILHLNLAGALILQGFCGFVLLYLTVKLTEELTKDKTTGILLGILVGSIYAGITAFVELRGNFDGVGICFLIAALYLKNPILIGLSTFLAAWTDERALIASSLVMVFHVIRNDFGVKFFHPKTFAIAISWIVYFAIRFHLSQMYDWKIPDSGLGFSTLYNQINLFPYSTWIALEGGWLFITAAILLLFIHRSYIVLALLIIPMLLILTTSISVVDITRSMAFILPALFIAVKLIGTEEIDLPTLRNYALYATLLSLISTNYYAGGEKSIWWLYPFPLQLLRWTLGT